LEIIKRIQQAIEDEPDISRRKLSRQVCTWLDWKAFNGKLQEMSCRKALNQLDAKGCITLPKVSHDYAFNHVKKDVKGVLPDLQEIAGTIDKLGKIEIIPIENRRHINSSIWHALMKEYHPLGNGPLCGSQIRYLVRSSECGWLGALSFSAAAWHLKDRDTLIGWSESAHRANLQYVICNSRFLILPTVRVTNLASNVLSKVTKRLCSDWEKRYSYKPVLVETYVDPAYPIGKRAHHHTGTSYKASNWIEVGQTAGRENPYPNGKKSTGKKIIYLLPLRSDWQQVLCREPEYPLGTCRKPDNPADWVEAEFGGVKFFDDRLIERLYCIVRDLYEKPGALGPQACDGLNAKVKGMYRFMSNPKVEMDLLLRPHIESTLERIKKYPVVLAVQDTTSLNHSSHPYTKGMGPIMDKSKKTSGMFMHDTLAFSEDGTPLGLLNVQCWARGPEDEGKGKKRHSLPIEKKESYKWIKSYLAACEVQRICPETQIISVGDREADIYELFIVSKEQIDGAGLVIRSIQNRCRKTETGDLWESMAKHPVSGYREILVPPKGNRTKRIARMSVRFSKVNLKPPQSKKDLPEIPVWAVYVKEDEPPQNEEPIEWMLLTTVKTETVEQANRIVEWYAKRWGVEVFHRTLKSGCNVEKRRFKDIERLKNSLAIDLVIAWRIYYLTINGRKTPDISCESFLSEEEWKVLCLRKKKDPEKAPTLKEAIFMIAGLGGYLNRASDGYPGCTVMWRGLEYLATLVAGYKLAQPETPGRGGFT